MPKLPREALDQYLNNIHRINSYQLKNHLYNFNLKERKCESCGITNWLNGPAPLELHHIDGNSKNNNLTNLKIVCCNCHSMTDNFRASNTTKSKKRKNFSEEQYQDAIKKSTSSRQACILLGIAPYGGNYQRITKVKEKFNLNFREQTEEEKAESYKKRKDWAIRMVELRKLNTEPIEISRRKNKYVTTEEARCATRKVKMRPTKEELENMMKELSILAIGKRYEVADNTIRKWIKSYEIEIPVRPFGYWRRRQVGMSHDEAMNPPEKVERNQVKQLTLEQVKEIKQKLSTGSKIIDLSKEYGFSYECIKSIKYGYTYSTVN